MEAALWLWAIAIAAETGGAPDRFSVARISCPFETLHAGTSTLASGRAEVAIGNDWTAKVEDLTPEERGLVASALGLELLSRGDVERATACLETAEELLPDSAVIARDLAIAYAQGNRYGDAMERVERAIRLGDADSEVRQLRAILLAELGRNEQAIEETRRTATWESDLIGAALGDGAAAYRVADLTNEPTQRAALSALVLAAHAGDHGEQATARLLNRVASDAAEASDSPIVLNAVRSLERRLDERGGMGASARLRTSIDHTTNPSFLAGGTGGRGTGLRLAVTGEGALQIPIATARVDAALRLDQHVFLTSRDEFRDLDLTGLTLAASVELPISNNPSAAVVGLRARFSDAFGRELKIHYATTIEGGPNLILPLTSATRIELGLYGIATDYIDVSPPDSKISSVNRDVLGQRATAALSFRADWLEGRAEMMFLRDNALGDAFDAIGGAAAGRLRAYPGGGVVLGTGLAVTIRQFGPVGDQSIIGSASLRTEVRTVVELGARIPVTSSLFFVLNDVWIQNSARALHAYTENILSTGMEQVW
jgi:tetratricopeptide (TPR) repeat protein